MNESSRPYAPPDDPNELPEPDIITYDDFLSETELDFNRIRSTDFGPLDEFIDDGYDLEDDFL